MDVCINGGDGEQCELTFGKSVRCSMCFARPEAYTALSSLTSPSMYSLAGGEIKAYFPFG